MPGAGQASLETLRALLTAVSVSPYMESVIQWPTPQDTVTVRKALRQLGSCGLVRKVDRRTVALTDVAKRWLAGEPNDLLIGAFHAHVRYMGELLADVSSNSLTHDELLQVANKNYDFGWSSLDPLRRRTTWLRALGLLDISFDHKIVITPEGVDILKYLVIQKPEELPHRLRQEASELFNINPPGEVLTGLLENLDSRALKNRKPVIGYVPRGSRDDALDSFRLLVGSMIPRITRQELNVFCRKEFGIQESSVAGTLSMLRGTGLAEQVSIDEFAATPAACEWIETGDNLDLVRIIHSNISCFGEILYAIEVADQVPALTAYLVRSYGMPRKDVAGVRTRIQILRACGLLEEAAFARYRLTSLARSFRDTIPLLRPEKEREEVSSENASEELDAAQSLRITSSRLLLAAELISASTDSTNPRRLELAVAKAFHELGLPAEHHGLPGSTDVVVMLGLGGNETEVAIVDAKSSASGVVTEHHVDFDTLREHKKKHNAQLVALVGPSFEEGRLFKRAKEHEVSLIDIDLLATTVRNQQDSPLAPSGVRLLFHPDAKTALQKFWTAEERSRTLISHVLAVVVREAANPDPVFGGVLTPKDVYALLRNEMEVKPSIDQIENALDLLASPLIRGISKTKNGYLACEHPFTTSTRLRSLATSLEQTAGLLES